MEPLAADFESLHGWEGVRIELKYATPANFMGRDVYGDFRKAYLHREAALKFREAIRLLRQDRAGWEVLVLDALRPRSVQRLLWAHVVGTPEQGYVANPERGSMHCYGCAIDLTLLDEQGREVDMGTAFDAFTPLSQPRLEEEFLKSGALSPRQHENRLILRRAMTGAGFLQLAHEWWHYNAFPEAEVRQRFKIVE